MPFTVKINGLRNLQLSRNKVGKAIEDVSARNIRSSLQRAINAAREKPPRRGNYRRKGIYERGFGIIRAGKLKYKLINKVPYAKYVGGDSRSSIGRPFPQAKWHQGRWKLIRVAILDEVKELVEGDSKFIKEITREIQNVVDS